MNWLENIFEAQDDKARLVTTIIAAIIAIVVVVFNQWFNSRRVKKEKLIEKIEEYYLCLINAQDIVSTRHAEIVSNFQHYRETDNKSAYHMFHTKIESRNPDEIEIMHREFLQTAEKMHMLSSLYIPEIKKSTEQLKKYYLDMHINFINAESLSEYLESSRDSINNIEQLFPSMFNELSSLMKSRIA